MANVPGGHRPTPNSNQRPQGTRFRTDSQQPRVQTPQQGAYARTGSTQGQRAGGGTRFANQQRPAQPGAGVTGGVAPAYTRSQQPQKKTSPVPVIIGILIAIAVVAGAAFFVFPAMFGGGDQAPAVEAGQQVSLTIPEGASGDTIASILSENHVIEDPSTYYAAVKKLGAEMSLKPGDYQFLTGQDPLEVVKQLTAGPNVESVKLTIPEGKTISQVAAIVEETYGIPADDFKAQAKASTYVADFPFLEGAGNDSLEGFLFPKTYTFSGEPSSDAIIRAMLQQYQVDVIDALDFEAARALVKSRYGLDMTDYDLLSLASVVEREGLNADQRAHVAGVFFNRLAGKGEFAGRPYLESDATLMYETGGAVTADDIQSIDSPYNSYKNGGLPPTPICSPSVEALSATLNPTDTKDLYFYITQDEEFFSETYDQHQQSW